MVRVRTLTLFLSLLVGVGVSPSLAGGWAWVVLLMRPNSSCRFFGFAYRRPFLLLCLAYSGPCFLLSCAVS